jgi:arsenite methyltransferase
MSGPIEYSNPGGALPPGLARALPLLSLPPEHPDVTAGYLDLIGASTEAPRPGLIQSLWSSGPGSAFWDLTQRASRRTMAVWRTPVDWLELPEDGVLLDIGCGTGAVTAELGDEMGSLGLALGVDISAPMLARAVRTHSAPHTGFLRADARDLPFRSGIAHGVISMAALQLMPDPALVVGEMIRMLRPGGRLAVMVPTVADGLMRQLFGLLPASGGAHFFTEEEIADAFEAGGLVGVRCRQSGPMQWVRGRRPE